MDNEMSGGKQDGGQPGDRLKNSDVNWVRQA